MHENQIIRYMVTKKYDEQNYNCWDFVRDVYYDMNEYVLPEYPLTEVPQEFKDRLVTNIKHEKINKEEAKEGDIIIYSAFADKHAGVMLDNEHFIHLGKASPMVTNKNEIGGNYAIYRIIE